MSAHRRRHLNFPTAGPLNPKAQTSGSSDPALKPASHSSRNAPLSGRSIASDKAVEPPYRAMNGKTWSILAFGVVAVISILLSITPVSGADIWWHIKTGEWIINNRALPTRDLFTFTVSPDTPYNDILWMFQALVAVIYHAGGWNALIALRAVWVLLLFVALWGWLRKQSKTLPSAFLALLTVLTAARYRFFVRPETLTFSLLAFQLWGLEASIRRGRIFLIPLLLVQWFWANWHSSNILGIFLSIAFVGSQLCWANMQGPKKSKTPCLPARELWIYLLGCLLVTLLNPRGWQSPAYGLIQSQNQYIHEFQPPSWDLLAGSGGFVVIWFAFGLLRGRSALGSNPLFSAILIAAFAVQSLRMFRFFPYFAIASIGVQAEGIAWIFRKAAGLPRLLRLAAAILGLAAFVAFQRNSFKLQEMPFLQGGVNDAKFPVAAADFILRENIQGNLYNEFSSGGYLIYRLAPARKVFIFGEPQTVGPLLDRVMSIREPSEWGKMFDEYQIDYALILCARPPVPQEGGGATLSRIIFETWPGWKLVFWDDTAMVFVKDTPAHHDLITRRACRVFPEPIPYPDNPVMDLFSLERFLDDTSQSDAIERELVRSISESPRRFRAALALAMLREKRGNDPQGTMEAYRQAEAIFPDDPVIQQCLGRYYLSLGRFDDSIAYMRKSIRNKATRISGLYNIALIQWQAGRMEQGLKTIEELLRLDPANHNGLKLRDLLRNHTPPPPPSPRPSSP